VEPWKKARDPRRCCGRKNAASGDQGGSVTCDASGNFESSGVPPGDYYALAAREISPIELSFSLLDGSAKLKAAEANAARVRVENARRIHSVAAGAGFPMKVAQTIFSRSVPSVRA
jgi:hypothetical protein